MINEPPDVSENVARIVRASMTDEERRYADDEAYNPFLALDLEDADVLYVLTDRAHAAGLEDVDAYIAGFTAGAHAVLAAITASRTPAR